MSLSFFPCDQCGKVCKSIRGLTQHHSIHRPPVEFENPIQGFRHEYHPLLNGEIQFSTTRFYPLTRQLVKECLVIIMAIFFR